MQVENGQRPTLRSEVRRGGGLTNGQTGSVFQSSLLLGIFFLAKCIASRVATTRLIRLLALKNVVCLNARHMQLAVLAASISANLATW